MTKVSVSASILIVGQDIKTGEFKSYLVRKCISAKCKNPAYVHVLWAGQDCYYCVNCARWMIKVGNAMGDSTPRKTARIMRRSEIVMDNEPLNSEDFAHNKAVFDIHDILYGAEND